MKKSPEPVRPSLPFWRLGQPNIPVGALVLAFGALIVPVVATVFVPREPSDFQVLLWLMSLLPAFLLAFYRGWRGVAIALAVGVAVLILVQLALVTSGRALGNWPLLVGVTVAYACIALGLGFLSELLHRERMRAEQLALTDEVTGLPNRRYVRLMLETEFAAAQRGRPLVLVFFDIDRFKSYNDTYGHLSGDNALRTFAAVLRSQTRSMNLSGRYGGEEFVSILSSCEVTGALVFVERVKNTLRETPLDVGCITSSAGVAAYSPNMTSPDELIAAADAALYRAKSDAIDRVEVFNPGDASVFQTAPLRERGGAG